MLKPIVINCGEQVIEFSMELDPHFVQDNAISYYLKNGVPPEPELVYFMMRAVEEGDSVIDAGANVGFFSLLLARLVGQGGRVLSIEPGANNVQKLVHNIKLNNIANITLGTVALADSNREIDFYLCNDSGINSAWVNEAASRQKTTVNGVRLDDIWVGKIAPKLIKMDIEGSELQALRGARNLLALHPNFIIMEFNEGALQAMGASVADIRHFLHDFGYELFILSELGFFPAHVPLDFPVKVERNNTNVLFTTFKDLQLAFAEVTV